MSVGERGGVDCGQLFGGFLERFGSRSFRAEDRGSIRSGSGRGGPYAPARGVGLRCAAARPAPTSCDDPRPCRFQWAPRAVPDRAGAPRRSWGKGTLLLRVGRGGAERDVLPLPLKVLEGTAFLHARSSDGKARVLGRRVSPRGRARGGGVAEAVGVPARSRAVAGLPSCPGRYGAGLAAGAKWRSSGHGLRPAFASPRAQACPRPSCSGSRGAPKRACCFGGLGGGWGGGSPKILNIRRASGGGGVGRDSPTPDATGRTWRVRGARPRPSPAVPGSSAGLDSSRPRVWEGGPSSRGRASAEAYAGQLSGRGVGTPSPALSSWLAEPSTVSVKTVFLRPSETWSRLRALQCHPPPQSPPCTTRHYCSHPRLR